MASEKPAAFQEWFTAKRRRRVGGVLLVAWIVGLVVHPSTDWIYLMIPGILFFFSAWPAEVHDKR